MKGATLGISGYYHDSAAALIAPDGSIVSAAQEERFSREKHTNAFPVLSIRSVLNAGKIAMDELDSIVFYDKPLLKFERLLETVHAFAPRGSTYFRSTAPYWGKRHFYARSIIRKELEKLNGSSHVPKLLFSEHHLSHAASAFYPSPYEEAAILTVDGVGEWTTASIGIGRSNEIRVLQELEFPHSLGLFYTACTTFCGFRANEDEYKLMGLAAYGNADASHIEERMLREMVDIKEDGSFGLDMRYFDFAIGGPMYNAKAWERLLSIEPRGSGEPLTHEYEKIAGAAQRIVGRVMMQLASHARGLTGMKHLVMAGGVALNCIANGELLRSGIFDDIWVQPAAGDAGGALGAALAGHSIWSSKKRYTVQGPDAMRGTFLGPSFSATEIETAVREADLSFTTYPSPDALCDEVAQRLARGEVAGWFQGAMEWGPRALGHRSILADPRKKEMRDRINEKVKHREKFRPFAPAVREEDVSRYFKSDRPSPYMLFACKANAEGLATLPAAIHEDGSARIQTVSSNTDPLFHALLSAFKTRTGCGALINTSFNDSDEPIVCTPAEACRTFASTHLDLLAIGNIIAEPKKTP